MSTFKSNNKNLKNTKKIQRAESALLRAASAAINSTHPGKGKRARRKPQGFSVGLGKQTRNQGVYRMTIPLRRECLGAVSTTGSAFAVQNAYVLNPGNNTTFPWLSAIASKFEKYHFSQLRFHFESSSATAVSSTNTALGTVLLNTNYDVLDSQFASQVQMEDYGGATEAAPSRTTNHVVDCKGRIGGVAGERYVIVGTGSTNTYPSNSSAHDYDLGLFQVATGGQQAASVVGRLYVEYSVTLIRPKTETPVGQNLLAAHWSGTGAATAAAPWTGLSQASGTTMTLTLSGTTLTLPAAGRYLVVYQWVGTSAAGASSFVSGTATLVASYPNTSVVQANTSLMAICGVDVTAAGQTITFSGGTFSSSTSASLWVTQIPGGLALSEPLSSELDEIRSELAALRLALCQRPAVDSDFDEEEKAVVGPSSTPVRYADEPLSRSTLGLIGELIASKTGSHKKA